VAAVWISNQFARGGCACGAQHFVKMGGCGGFGSVGRWLAGVITMTAELPEDF